MAGGPAADKSIVVYTVGHSNLPVDAFLDILRRHAITLVVDIRSEPYSRYAPHFNKREMEGAVVHAGLRYRYAGATLGGKPRDPGLLGPHGVPDYDRIAATPAFQQALADLCDLAASERVVVVCSEADPTQCHRDKLVARELRTRGVDVRHILSDGSLAGPPAQGTLL